MTATAPTRVRSWKAQVNITIGVLFGGILLVALLATPSDHFRYRSGPLPKVDATATHGAYLAPMVSTERLPRYESWFDQGDSPLGWTVAPGDPDDWKSAASDLLVGRGLDDDFRARLDAVVSLNDVDTTVEGDSWELAAVLLAVDDATDGDLTGGRLVAATGTVAADGAIGSVVALDVKADDAARSGATVLFAPSSIDHPDIDVVEVATPADAVAWLCAHGADDDVCENAP